MQSKLIALLVFMLLVAMQSPAQEQPRQTSIVLDEDSWVAFYDLPSRRFRAIRTAILNRDGDAASRDLLVTANFVSVEAERSSPVFQAPLRDVVDRLRGLSENTDTVTLKQLDALFGRTHWLLAQHYLQFARQARDARQGRNTSLYLWATTHHMERAILWSNAAVTREVHKTLEELRELAGRLQDPQRSARAFAEKPIVRAERLLRKIGEQIDRPVLLPPAQDNAGKSGPGPSPS